MTPKYKTRSQWGAKPPKAVNHLKPAAVDYVVVHHTTGNNFAGTDEAAMLRSIQRFHQDSKGWLDIAYSFLVASDSGDVYEGRGWDVVGGHTEGYNSRAIGIAILGNGDAGDADGAPSVACLASIRNLHAAAQARYGSLNRLGHRDVADTHCPGDAAYTWWKGRMLLPAGAVGAPIPGYTPPQPTPGPAPKPTPDPDGPGGRYPVRIARKTTIRQGSTGATVKGWQTVLKVTPDGDFGPATHKATVAFQAFFRLTADGVVGPKTWAVAKYLGLVA